MKRLAASLIALALSSITFAAPPATTQSGTRYAARQVQVDGENVGLSSSDVDDFAHKRAAELGAEILHVEQDDLRWLETNFIVSQGAVKLQVIVKLPDPQTPPVARELADRLSRDVGEFIKAGALHSRDQELRPLSDARDEAAKRLQDAQNRVEQLRKQIREVAHRADVSVKNINEAVTRLEEERQKLELDQMGKAARRSALEKEIAEQTAKIQQKAAADPIGEELKTVVKARMQHADQLQKLHDSGQASMTEVSDAMAAAAEARAKLLERQRDAATEAGGDAIANLNHELLNLTVDLRELDARLEYVKQRLPGLLDAIDRVDDLDRAQGDLAIARDELVAADKELRQFNLRTNRTPQVTIRNLGDRAEVPEERRGLFGGGRGGGGY